MAGRGDRGGSVRLCLLWFFSVSFLSGTLIEEGEWIALIDLDRWFRGNDGNICEDVSFHD